MSNDLGDFAMLLAAASGVAAFSWYSSFRGLVKARIIEDTPTSKIRSAHQGYVELTGFCRNGVDSIIAPLTGSPCLWYRFQVEKYQRRGKHSSWVTVEKGASQTPILLEDGTGQCFVYPDRADISVNLKKVWYGGTPRPTSLTNGGLFNRRYRYTEERLHADEFLYCIGRFATIHAPSAAELTRAKKNEILNQWKQDYDALTARFDRDGDGNIDMQEWERARKAAEVEAAAAVRGDTPAEPVNAMTYSPESRQPYLISTHEPKKLSRRYRWQFAGFGALALACTVFVVIQFPQLLAMWRAGS